MTESDVLVIGAGVAGLACAQRLTDRGRLQTGGRADVIRVGRVGRAASVRGVWVQGQRVA